MELRLSGEENKTADTKPAGLKASSPNEKKMEDNPWDYDKFKDLEDPGAFDSIRKPIRIDVPPDHEYSVFPKVTKVLMYIAVILTVCLYALMCIGNPVDILFRIDKYKLFIGLCNGILFFDAIIVNLLYERKISLLIVAWLFPFAYPTIRNQHVDDQLGLGGICCFVIIAAFIATSTNVYRVYAEYGTICTDENETLRHGVAEIYATASGKSETVGTYLRRNYRVASAKTNEQGSVIQLDGYGNCYMGKSGYEPTVAMEVPTILTFQADSAGVYRLVKADLDGAVLTDSDLSKYQEYVLYK